MRRKEDKRKAPKENTRIRISFSLQNKTERESHCFGINSLLLQHNGVESIIFSAGRDSSIRSWFVNNKIVTHNKAYEDHSDWVNDLLLLNNQRLLSCSSDSSIKLWSIDNASVLHTYSWHKDYVKVLATGRNGKIASAGLDGNIFLWDLERDDPMTITCGDPPESLYSAVMSEDGSIIAVGSTRKLVSVFDVRSAQRITTLEGHLDNIKALLTDRNGIKIISGSSDSTIKEWDIRAPSSCISTLRVHDDAVWSLHWGDLGSDGHDVFSGGRDGTVCKINLQTKERFLICQEPSPILKVVPDHVTQTVWVSTTTPTINNWEITPYISFKDDNSERKNNSEFHENIENGEGRISKVPVKTIAGHSGIIKYHNLLNRRHVLTANSDGRVVLWDVCNACIIKDYGIKDQTEKSHVFDYFEKISQELFEMNSSPNWFAVDVKTGTPVIHLDIPECFHAKVIFPDAGFPPWIKPTEIQEKENTDNKSNNGSQNGEKNSGEASKKSTEDTEYNLGERLLMSLFENWTNGVLNKQKEHQSNKQKEHQSNKQVENNNNHVTDEKNTQNQQPTNGSNREQENTGNNEKDIPSNINLKNASAQKSSENNKPQEKKLRNSEKKTPKPPSEQEYDQKKQTDKDIIDSILNPPFLSKKISGTDFSDSFATNSSNYDSADPVPTSNFSGSLASVPLRSSSSFSKSSPHKNSTTFSPSHSSRHEGPGKEKNNNSEKENSKVTESEINSVKKYTPKLWPLYDVPKTTPVVISETNLESGITRSLYRKMIGEYDGSEELPPVLKKCLLEGDYSCRAEPKVNFYLGTEDNKSQPKKYQSSRLLRISRISIHLVTSLDIILPGRKNTQINNNTTTTKSEEITPTKNTEETVPAEEYIQIICNGQILPPHINIATVQQFYWKVKDELRLSYRMNPSFDGPLKFKSK